ncbi:MAG: LON peptidase substrate-binding domain-containing protein, partial [Hoylesella buccalis]
MSKKNNPSIQMIADFEGDISNLFHVETEGDVPILATRNMVMFPGVLCPILIGRENSLKLIEKAKKAPNTIFAIFCQRDADVEEPHQKDLYAYGVYARLVRVLEMPGHGQNVTAIIQ